MRKTTSGGVCVNGEGLRAGCRGKCIDTVVDGAQFVLTATYDLSGTLVDADDKAPIAAMDVSLASYPTFAGHIVQTDSSGRFRIVAGSGPVEQHELGSLPTKREFGRVQFLLVLTSNFKARHPDFMYRSVEPTDLPHR